MLNAFPTPLEGDSWDITERCRVLAHSLVNLDSSAARDEVCRQLTQLLSQLSITLTQPIPPHRLTPSDHYRHDGLYDNRSLNGFELWDHCGALAYALLRTDHPTVKETLCFILWERINALRSALDRPQEKDNDV